MLEKYKAANRAKAKALQKPEAVAVEEEQKQLSVVEQFKQIQQEQNQTLLKKLQQKYSQ